MTNDERSSPETVDTILFFGADLVSGLGIEFLSILH